MNVFLSLAYLFFIGSLLGWVLELFFRKFFSPGNPEHKWINPGFCVGPYVPLYGTGLCIMYLMARLTDITKLGDTVPGTVLVVILMGAMMTLIEYIAGILLLKFMSLRLWDYSKRPGNINGLICPLFSIIWTALGAAYYFLVHPHILDALKWLSENLAFSFVIGYFFGVFTIDVVYSANIVTKLRRFARDNDMVVKLENLKSHLHSVREEYSLKKRFFTPFSTKRRPITDYLAEAKGALEARRHKAKLNRLK